MHSTQIAIVGLIAILLFVPVAQAANHEEEKSMEKAVLQDITDHWAEGAIHHAVSTGYVSGYLDETFRPNHTISRAEFITMLVKALEIEHASSGTPWYEPYVIAAIDQHIHDESDFTDYAEPLTRLEMVRLAIRAIDGNKDDNQAYLVAGAESGILQGIGDGALAPTGTSTRAQAVAIIERILTVQAGGKLPVDEKAVSAAQNIQLDPWGRVIRTTNLPKNADEFPYILEEIPNEMYEMELRNTFGTKETASDITSSADYDREAVELWENYINHWGTQLLNVNYKTVESENWGEEFMKPIIQQGKALDIGTSRYVEWVKENQIIIEGSIRAEPSIIQYSDANYYLRVYFQFRIIQFPQDSALFNDHWYGVGNYEKNRWYEGHADVALSTKTFRGSWMDYKVKPTASLFGQGNIRLKE